MCLVKRRQICGVAMLREGKYDDEIEGPRWWCLFFMEMMQNEVTKPRSVGADYFDLLSGRVFRP